MSDRRLNDLLAIAFQQGKDEAAGEIRLLAGQLADARADLEKAEKALREYADRRNWARQQGIYERPVCLWIGDGSLDDDPLGSQVADRYFASVGGGSRG